MTVVKIYAAWQPPRHSIYIYYFILLIFFEKTSYLTVIRTSATAHIDLLSGTPPAAMALATDLYSHKAANLFPKNVVCNSYYSYYSLGSCRLSYCSLGSSRLRYCKCSRTPLVVKVSSIKMKEEKALLQKGIADFYDQSSGLWEGIWGDHMHHGFYDTDALPSVSNHRVAQIRMIEEALRFAGLSVDAEAEAEAVAGEGESTIRKRKRPKSMVDVGCGIGGSSRYIAAKYGAKSQGITLSPFQAQRANALAAAQGLSDKVSFQVADALEQPFGDGQFDLVWSMESGEHMPDKAKFVNELVRVAAPGGTIIIVTWCHRDLEPGEESLQPWEKTLLNKICDAYYLPAWCSTADYVRLLHSLSLQDIKAADWSQNVAPFWPAVIRSALTWKGLTSLLRSGMKTIKGALAMPLMIQGYKKNVIKFAVITCRKPDQ